MKVCIVGASGKLGRYMAQHALDRGYEVVGVCREQSVGKLDAVQGAHYRRARERRTIRTVIERAVAGCDGVLVVLVPRGVHHYAIGNRPGGARLLRRPGRASCSRADGTSPATARTCTPWKLRTIVKVFGPVARLARFADLDDQVEACRRVFASDTRWTVRPRQRPRGRREPGPARLEPARGRPHPREQHHAPCGLRPVHGRGPGKRRARP